MFVKHLSVDWQGFIYMWRRTRLSWTFVALDGRQREVCLTAFCLSGRVLCIFSMACLVETQLPIIASEKQPPFFIDNFFSKRKIKTIKLNYFYYDFVHCWQIWLIFPRDHCHLKKNHHISDQSPLWQNKEFYKKKTTSTNITREGDFLHKKVVAHKQWFFWVKIWHLVTKETWKILKILVLKV